MLLVIAFSKPWLVTKKHVCKEKRCKWKEERNLIQTVIHDDLHEVPDEILDQPKHPSFLSR